MKKIAFVFLGQGSQYVGMGAELCKESVLARRTFEEANEALGFDLQKLCFEGDLPELTKTENTQPAILTASVAAFRVYLQEIGAAPDFTAGHSLGELSALVCSGAVKFTDAVKLVRLRGKFMQEAVALGVGAMSAISKMEQSVIEEECRKISSANRTVVVSNINSPEQIVISGHLEAVTEAGEKLKEMGARVIPLKVSAPFHSPLMQPAADLFKAELLKCTYEDLRWPVISNVTALPYESKDKILENLTLQIVKPVQWRASMAYLEQQGVETAVEMGPGNVLKNLMKSNAKGIVTFSLDKPDDRKALAEMLATNNQPAAASQAAVQEPKKVLKLNSTVVTRCLAIAVCTRNRNWNDEEYQKGVVEPYRKIQQLQDELEKDGKEPTKEQMQSALDMLRSVFVTKQTPVEEQVSRFNQVFDETGTRGLFADFKMPV
jgi:[acyl-carrier-protein] S-malonyltransferase